MGLIFAHEELFIRYTREYPVGRAWQAIKEASDKRRRVRESLAEIRTRLTALETELEDLRHENAIHRHPIFGAALRGEVTSIELQPPYGLPCTSEYVNAQRISANEDTD